MNAVNRLYSGTIVVLLCALALVAARQAPVARPDGHAAVVAAALPLVLDIHTLIHSTAPGAVPSDYIEDGSGSGVVVDPRGYIVTCNHVVVNTDVVLVTLGSDQLEAQVVAKDELQDLALLKVDHTFPHAATWGDSSTLLPGDFVFCIGYPFDIAELVSFGCVSAVLTIHDFPCVVTDAALNPGNSGGGLFDSKGDLIGLSARIYSPQGLKANVGIAYALQGNLVHNFVLTSLPKVTP